MKPSPIKSFANSGGDVSARGGNVAALGHGMHYRAVSVSQSQRDPDDVVVYCHNGDCPLAFKAHLRAIGLLPSRSGFRPNSAPVLNAVGREDEAERTARALALWRQSSIAKQDCIVGAYLLSRSITLLPPSLRFQASCSRGRNHPALPALVALVTVPTTGEQNAVHRIYLRADGNGKAELPRDLVARMGRPAPARRLWLWRWPIASPGVRI